MQTVCAPASYFHFVLIVNILSWPLVKVGWYGLSVDSLVVLGRLLLCHSLACDTLERVFIGLMPLSFSASGTLNPLAGLASSIRCLPGKISHGWCTGRSELL